jgi:hypothetical protein
MYLQRKAEKERDYPFNAQTQVIGFINISKYLHID